MDGDRIIREWNQAARWSCAFSSASIGVDLRFQSTRRLRIASPSRLDVLQFSGVEDNQPGGSMKIVFNGQEYSGVDQMPPAVRQEYESLMQAFSKAEAGAVPGLLKQSEERLVVDETITWNGREYKNRSDLPPEAQRLLAELPLSKSADAEPRMIVKTKVLPPKVEIVSTQEPEVHLIGDSRRPFPWGLVLILLGVIGVLTWLWLAGIRPQDLFRH
jgi:hypothetical protein